jgi:hypothetical protein
MPEPRRTAIRERFADRVERLRTAGLDAPFLNRDPNLSNTAARAVAEHYFRLGLVCPFLEDDACSIYPDRPFVCRQYLVTSPAELCADPFHNPVKPLPVPIAAAGAVLATATELLGRPQYTIPLVLALDYATAHRTELEHTFPSPDLFRRSLSALSRSGEEDEPTVPASQEPSP